MRKEIGVSSFLAGVASFLVIGMVAAGSAAVAASEEDLAAPQGSFTSTMPVPAAAKNVVYIASKQPAVGSEEDLAAPQGSFTTTMAVPAERPVRVGFKSEADAASFDDLAQARLREQVAATLE